MPAPTGFKPLWRNEYGVQKYVRHNGDGTMTVCSQQDVDAVLASNREQAKEPVKGRLTKRGRWGVKVATIPHLIWLKWLQEEGWDAYAPENNARLTKKLNDPDYKGLRTAEMRL